MASYKTPGVYIEEIVKFPPSVAQVETAIPAFIGYTEIAKRKTAGDLSLKPTRITSMLEYETYFGFAKPEEDITVLVTGTDIEATGPGANKSPFLMYYSMQMYFANGGGPCYIVSVDQYGSGTASLIKKDDLSDGLAAIRKEDEPTLLLFPDATSMTSAEDVDFYSIYRDALTQCNELQDRFTIIDTFSDATYDPGSGDVEPIFGLRNGIGNEKDYLKYGAVYYPFLETILDYQYDSADVAVTLSNGQTAGDMANEVMSKISSTELVAILTKLGAIHTQISANSFSVSKNDLKTNIDQGIAAIGTLKHYYDALLSIGLEEPTVNTESTALSLWISTTIDALLSELSTRLDELNTITSSGGGKPALTALIDGGANSLVTAYGIANIAAPTVATIITNINNSVIPAGAAGALVGALDGVAPSSSTITTLAAIEVTDNLLFNRIKSEIGQLPVKLPPSSAMAGIYARIDKTKGVWKAPANVSLNYVIKPSVQISHEEQADMNVDVIAGKSVNAIRAFTGKGVLVWGARTLAGNDNEWRYVPVRRFFNMVEESVKKATDQFVFEGNDANTWVRLRAMIENFLVLQWRAGALTGAKPEQAFYVRIGLGQTMTADDILNGYMNVEIGMAVVRPAEFIVLKFSHKMQEA
jgi:phage tail sheath protein FI